MRRFQTIVPFVMLGLVALLVLLVGPAALRRYAVAEQSARIVLARDELAQDDILRRIDRAVAAIADSMGPSVVHLDVAGTRRNLSGSSGAGWVYDDLGHIVTNAHVVRGGERIAVEFSDGSVFQGSLVGSDVYTDIAVVRVQRDPTGLFAARRSPTRMPRVGEQVFAFGSPFGFKFSMSEGIVSGLGREAPGSSMPGGYTNYIQTDAAVNPGNSGGPLVNTDGHVIGMNVAIATARSIGGTPEDSGGDSAGISFAIPLGTIEPIVDQLIRYGSVSRGYLGIQFGGPDGGLDRVLGPDGVLLTGVRVSGVEAGGPSENAGIRAGDLIVAVRGSPVITREALSSLVSSGRPGDQVAVRVLRNGGIQDFSVTLAPIRPEVLAARLVEPTQMQSGMALRPAERGVLVVRVWETMPAHAAGLRAGDEIVQIDGQPFNGYDEFFVRIADAGLLSGDGVELTVIDAEGESRRVTLRLHN